MPDTPDVAAAADPQPEQPAEPSHPATFPLLTYLDGLMDGLRGRVPAALEEWEPEAIHQSRVATRRMKAALDLMRPVLGKKVRRSFARATRKLRRRLGPLRDADVMLEHLGELTGGGKSASAGVWLSERLGRERDRLRKQSTKQASSEDVLDKLESWHPVREQILVAHEAVDSLLAESLHLQLDAFAEQADRLGDAGTGGGEDGDAPPVPAPAHRQDPHELRISGKALRYTLEMAAEQGHELPASLTKTFKRMQEALGLWHDYVVLADHAMQAVLDEQLSHHEPALTNETLDLLRELVGLASRHLDEFKQMWADDGDAVAKAIRTCFPLTRPRQAPPCDASATGSKTGRGPTGSAPPAGPAGAPPAAP